MRNGILLILLLLSYPVTCSAATIKGKVVSVSSGDIFSFQDQSGEIRQVGLYGVDAPDDEQKMGQKAKNMLSAMIGDKDVEVKLDEGERKAKLPSADVSLRGLCINAALVKAGYAWVDQERCKSSNCKTWTEYQQTARKDKKGLWVDAEAEPPWKWRERRQKAEETARKLNAQSDYVTYYGSLAESGHRSLWAQKTLSTSIAPGIANSAVLGSASSSGAPARAKSRSNLSKAGGKSAAASPVRRG